MRYLMFFLAFVGCQSDQEIILESTIQGVTNPPPEVDPIQEDRSVQAVEPVVDILFVVDNSSSMGNEQVALRQNFPKYIEHFVTAGLDYHIAMVSTDMQRPGHNGQLRSGGGTTVITNDTPHPEVVFQQMTNSLGVHLGSIESGRAAAYTALELLKDTTQNHGFLREEADLHIIFVSDDDDQSGNNPITRPEFVEWATNLKQGDFEVKMHGIVTPEEPCNGNIPSLSYLRYAAVTEGVTFSICDQDWGPALQALGLQAAGLKREFFLTKIPVRFPELELQVQVATFDDQGNPLVLDFEVCRAGEESEEGSTCEVIYVAGRNSIVFLDYLPDTLAEVLVTYGIAENNLSD